MNHRPTMLMILDGYGIRSEKHGNAIAQADTSNIDALFSKYPFTTLEACGKSVGLPPGQMGNSEVGHLNIGAGNIIYQELSRISNSIEDKSFFSNEALLDAVKNTSDNKKNLHIIGLLSDGGVHSHIKHLLAVLDMAKNNGIENIYVHCLLDGRDVPPKSSGTYIDILENHMKKIGAGQIASVGGRFYGMDRDKRWNRLEKAYNSMVQGNAPHFDTAHAALKESYSNDLTDEFVIPSIIGNAPLVDDGDSVIFINFRPDRAREITRAFVDKNFEGFDRRKFPKDLHFTCMTQYDATIPNVLVAFPPQKVAVTLGKVIADNGLKQLRIAETEKYAHVTFFFNGGLETPNVNEDRLLVPSPKVNTYDMQPEMSAPAITEKVIEAINEDKYDLIILNFANADMVGHTGNFDATVKAVETLNKLVPKIVSAVLNKDGQILLTADHGNADYMLGDNNNIVTKHSLSKVPLCHICSEPRALSDGGKLSDISPTLLTLMGIPVPAAMKGKILV